MKLPQSVKYYFFAFGIPFLLVAFWAGKDIFQLGANYWEIRKSKRTTKALVLQKEKLEEQVKSLEKNDAVAWEKWMRQARALKPNEVEYRFR